LNPKPAAGDTLQTSYTIAKVWGIPIKLHISLLLIVLFLMDDFGFMGGLLMEIGLAVSIVLHELGHSLVAIRKGCRVREITLMCIGGAAQIERLPTKPLDEFLMAIAGPAVSLLLGFAGVFGGAYLPLPPFIEPLNIIQVIGLVNFALVIFNLLPSFPMDGGRIVRAMLTPKLGRLRATFIAARIGKIMAVLFGFYGVFRWHWILVFIAFFVYTAAGREYRMVRMQEAAKQQGGFGFDPFRFSPFGPPPFEETPPDNDDKVIVSPPPYAKGPDSRVDIHSSDDDNPFRSLFRH
jgi:Zn-dependent protease